MTLFRRALVAVLAVITMVPFLANGTASAAPATKATQAEVSTTKSSVLVKVSNGGVAVEDGKLVVRDTAGKVLETYPLNFIAPDNRTYPIDASVKGNTATLVPSTNVARSTTTSPELLAKTEVADRSGYKSKKERDDAALARLNQELAAGGTISALIGTAVGVVLGGILGAVAGCATVILCIPFIVTGAGFGGVIGTVVVGGPAAVVSIVRYFDTINKPFVHVKKR